MTKFRITPDANTKKEIEAANIGKFAFYQAMYLVLSGTISGLALAIAFMLQVPINAWIGSMGFEDAYLNTFLTIFVFFLVIVGVVLITIPLSKKLNKYNPNKD